MDNDFLSKISSINNFKFKENEVISTEARNVYLDKIFRINRNKIFNSANNRNSDTSIIFSFNTNYQENLELFKKLKSRQGLLMTTRLKLYYMPRSLNTKVAGKVVFKNLTPMISTIKKNSKDYGVDLVTYNLDLITNKYSSFIDMGWLSSGMNDATLGKGLKLNPKIREEIMDKYISFLESENFVNFNNKILYFKYPFINDLDIKTVIKEIELKSNFRPSLFFLETLFKNPDKIQRLLSNGFIIVFEGRKGEILTLNKNHLDNKNLKLKMIMKYLTILDGASIDSVKVDPEFRELNEEEIDINYDDDINNQEFKPIVSDKRLEEIEKRKNEIRENVDKANRAKTDKSLELEVLNSEDDDIKTTEDFYEADRTDEELKAEMENEVDEDITDPEPDNEELVEELTDLELGDTINSKKYQRKNYFEILDQAKIKSESEITKDLMEIHNYTELRDSVESGDVKSIRQKLTKEVNSKLDEAIDVIKKHQLDKKELQTGDINSDFNKSNTYGLNETYKEKLRDLDLENILKAPVNLSFPIILKEYKKKPVINREFNGYELHVVYETHNGEELKFNIIVPETLEGGNLFMGGNNKLLLLQNASKPVIKQENSVIVTTAYNKSIISLNGVFLNHKLKIVCQTIKKFIKDSTVSTGIRVKTTTDLGEFIYKNRVSTNLIHLCKHFIGILNEYTNIDFRGMDSDDIEIDSGMTLLGYYKKSIVLHDPEKDTIVYKNNTYDSIDFICNVIRQQDNQLWNKSIQRNITSANISVPYARVMGHSIPVVLVILVAIKLNDLLELLKKDFDLEYRVFDKSKINDLGKFKSNRDYGVIELSDTIIILKYNNLLNELLLGYLTTIDLTEYDSFDVTECIRTITGNNNTIIYLENFVDQFVDPITQRVCRSLNIPDDFVGIFIYAVSLFTSYKTTYKSDIRNYRLSTQEEIIMRMLYDVISKPMSDAVARIKRGSRARIDIKPTALVEKLNGSSMVTMSEASGLSPFRTIVESNDVSVRGHNGINEERAFNVKLRMFNKNNLGSESCGTAYSGNAGITKQLPFNPTIKNLTGEYEHHTNTDDLNESSMAGFVDGYVPYSSYDHPVRRLMQYGQFKHIRPSDGSDPMLISTGVDESAVYMAKKHIGVAKDDGEVISINDRFIKVKYKNGQIDAFPLEVVQRNSDKGYYLKTYMNIKKGLTLGSKFKKDDIITFDKASFKEKGNGQVGLSAGSLVWVLQADSEAVWEDSCLPFEDLSKKLTSKIVKRVARILDINTEVRDWNVDIGSIVRPDTVLFKYKMLTDDETINEMFQNSDSLSLKSVTAHDSGKITDIRFYYRLSDKTKDLSASLNRFRIAIDNSQNSYNKLSDLDNVSDEFSKVMNDKRSQQLSGLGSQSKINGDVITNNQVLIEYFIEFDNKLGTADKVVLDRALKGEPTMVLENKYRPVGSESSRHCSLIYSTYSVLARMTGGLLLHGYLLSILLHIASRNRKILNRPPEPGSLLDYNSSHKPLPKIKNI